MNSIITVNHLSFTYPDGRQVLQDISLEIAPGEKVALIGANGAGKSTFLLHLNGILSGEGNVAIDGLSVNQESLGRVRAMVGLVFQNPDDQLFSPTVFEDVAFGLVYQGQENSVIREKVDEALSRVGMLEFKDRTPYHLSGGEKKRIAIATVLSMEPKIMVFDEPTAGLDPRARRELTSLLGQINQTMVIATHDLEMAETISTRTIIMDSGRIAADGLSEQILHDRILLSRHNLC